jgi:tetratricopeptide (TPR) repeat protein
MELREFAAAIDDLQAAQRLAPSEFTRHDLLAQAFIAKGDTASAIAAATAGLTTQPTNAELLVLRAQAHADERQYLETERDADAALAADVRHQRAFLLRGMARLHLGKLQEAEADLDQAIHFDMKNAIAHWLRAQVREQLDQPVLAEADRTRARELDPSLKLTDASSGDSLLPVLQSTGGRETLDPNLK